MRVRAAVTAALVGLTFTGAVLFAQAPDRSKPPASGPVPALKVPAIQKRTLTNGLPVWIVEMHEVPVVDVSLIVKSGATSDPTGKFGVASYTSAMLDEGAGTRSALELADAIDALGASLTTSSSYDASFVRLHSLASKLDLALPIMADVALRPTFPATDMDRLRSERLTGLIQLKDNASQLATAAFGRLLYGPTHRFGTGAVGTEATNKSMTTADLRAFHAAHYQPRNSHLLVVGDVSTTAILPKLERAFGTWKNGAGAAPVKPALGAAAPPKARQIVLVDKPGAPQSQIRVGTLGVDRRTADYHAIDVANTLLGGSFSSRLNMNLREDKGYSYGASSVFQMRLAPGPFYAAAGVQTDKTMESLVEFFKELDAMSKTAPAEELTRAKNLEALGFPGSFETTGDMAGQLADLVVYGLPETFFNEYVPKIQAVTAADVERIGKTFMQSSTLLVVVTGDLSKIEKPIRDANFGPVSVAKVDDLLK
jgi:zinc protease